MSVTIANLKRINILVVDDDKLMQKLIRDMLFIVGFQHVHVVSDGNAAISTLRNKEIDLIICDWIMRPMDGLTLLKFLRTSPDTPNRFVPIIMLTGKGEKHDVEEARDKGVTEYLVKPFTAASLFERIKKIIEHPRSFIMAPTFSGPDRRRKTRMPPDGMLKRQNDPHDD